MTEGGHILTGLWNKFLKTEEIEALYQQRLKVCREINDGEPCESYSEDSTKEGCAYPKFQKGPCCDKRNGGCGCEISLKLRVPAEECPKGKWPAVLSKEDQKLLEEEAYKQQFKK